MFFKRSGPRRGCHIRHNERRVCRQFASAASEFRADIVGHFSRRLKKDDDGTKVDIEFTHQLRGGQFLAERIFRIRPNEELAPREAAEYLEKQLRRRERHPPNFA